MWFHTMHFERSSGTAGFTLVEALVSLAVVAVSLSTISELVTTSVRGSVWLDQHVALIETIRSIETGLPDREQLRPGTFSGEIGRHRWHVDVTPFLANFVDPRLPTQWVPQSVIVQVKSPSGGMLEIDTVRLRRRDG